MSVSDEIIAVVVVTYNSERLLADLVSSLEPGLGGLSWHLTVADNASADATVASLRSLAPDATVVEMGRNAGYAAGINAAVATARPHTAILVLNPDVRLAPGCVRELVDVMRRTGAGIAVPKLVDGIGRLIPSMRNEPTILRAFGDAVLGATRAGRYGFLGEVVTDERRYASETETDWAEGSTVLISGECWHRCAPWDESFFLYSEETDFALRARDAGYVVRFIPTAHAVHLEGESRIAPPLWALLTVNRIRLYRRRHTLASTAVYYSVVLMRELSRAVLGRRPNQVAVRALLSPRRLRETPGPQTVQPAAQATAR